MQAIGLAWKKSRNKNGTTNGELMIIHCCDECETVSIYRIAADDNLEKLEVLFDETISMEKIQKEKLWNKGIRLLEYHHQPEFMQCLYGKN